MNEKYQTVKKIFGKYAEAYMEKYADSSPYQDCIDAFCRQITVDAPNIIDIGCGPGLHPLDFERKLKEFTYTGIDVSKEMLALAKKNYPKGEFHQMNAIEVGKFDQIFDAAFVSFCLPYILREDIPSFLQSCASILKPGSPIYLSCMLGTENESGWQERNGEKMYSEFYCPNFLCEQLLKAGFTNILLDRMPSPYPSEQSQVDIQIIANKSISA